MFLRNWPRLRHDFAEGSLAELGGGVGPALLEFGLRLIAGGHSSIATASGVEGSSMGCSANGPNSLAEAGGR